MRVMSSVVPIAFALVACGKGEKPATGGATSMAPPPAATNTTAAAPGGPPTVVTGKTWDVKMLGDATGYRFDPVSITIKPGDGVRWTVVSGPPHNVTFWSDSIPPAAVPALQRNMSQAIAQLTGPLLLNPSQTYLISFGGMPAGTYHYYCTPHLAVGMKATIVVQ